MDIALTVGHLRRRLAGRYEEWRDRALDRRYGIDTCSSGNHAAEVASLQPYRGYPYEPIQLVVFRRIMQALPAVPSELTFVDFGCGKGRALVLAAEHGFRRVLGIECDAQLFAAAQRNVRAYRDAARRSGDIEIHLGDATLHTLPPEDCLCFLYNPFDQIAMAKVLARIERSLREKPRRIFVAYRNPRHGALMSGAAFLRNLVRNRTFELYEAIRA